MKLLTCCLLGAASAATMKAVRATGACNAPFDCVKVEDVPFPVARLGHALIKMDASSVNPSDVVSPHTRFELY